MEHLRCPGLRQDIKPTVFIHLFNMYILLSEQYLVSVMCQELGVGVKGCKSIPSIDMYSTNIYYILYIFVVDLLLGDRQSRGTQK